MDDTLFLKAVATACSGCVYLSHTTDCFISVCSRSIFRVSTFF